MMAVYLETYITTEMVTLTTSVTLTLGGRLLSGSMSTVSVCDGRTLSLVSVTLNVSTSVTDFSPISESAR